MSQLFESNSCSEQKKKNQLIRSHLLVTTNYDRGNDDFAVFTFVR